MENGKVFYLTPEGKAALEAELEELIKVRRPELAKRLHAAIKQGDLSENADYAAAKEEQGFLEGRIQEIQTILRQAQMIAPSSNGDGRIQLGSTVRLAEEGYDEVEEYRIVGPTEADPQKGRISHESPLGKALIGRKKGETVIFHAPAGTVRFRILDVA